MKPLTVTLCRWETGPSGAAALLCALVALGVVTALPPGAAQMVRPFPLVVRMEGYVGEKPENVKALERWVFAVDGLPVTFHLTKLRVIGTDVAWWNIPSNLAPLPITLTLYGDDALRRRFLDTPPRERIALVGDLDTGPGPVTLLVLKIETLPEADSPAIELTPSSRRHRWSGALRVSSRSVRRGAGQCV